MDSPAKHGSPGTPHGDRRALLATCVAAAARGANEVRAGAARRDTLVWESKSEFDFVSDVDRASEAIIADVISARHRDASLLAEEGSPNADSTRGLVFVVDPLDGTTNFLHGVPWYAVSIAAMVDGDVVAGAILNAASGELFSATAGGGGGAAALDLADVACGRYDAFFELRQSPWDLAAGHLLVREAGGVITTVDGSPCLVAETSVLAGNPHMHAWLLATLCHDRTW